MCVILHMSVITQEGASALMAAAQEGKTEAVVELVKAGANVDIQTKVCQYILIHDVNVQNHTSRLKSKIVAYMFACVQSVHVVRDVIMYY